MKINKDSWHYKLVNKYVNYRGLSKPSNLCQYMRILTLLGFVGFVVAPTILFGMVLVGFVLYDNDPPIGLGILKRYGMVAAVYATGAYLLGCISLLGVFGVIIGQAIFKLASRRGSRKIIYRKSYKPNIFVEWLKGKKDKVCPLIEYTE